MLIALANKSVTPLVSQPLLLPFEWLQDHLRREVRRALLQFHER